MNRRSWIPLLLAVEIVVVFLVLSCGSRPPVQQISVRVPPGFAGTVHLRTCNSNAPGAALTTDAQGFAATSACPSRDGSIELIVLRGNEETTIAPENVTISWTGDHIATGIAADIRP